MCSKEKKLGSIFFYTRENDAVYLWQIDPQSRCLDSASHNPHRCSHLIHFQHRSIYTSLKDKSSCGFIYISCAKCPNSCFIYNVLVHGTTYLYILKKGKWKKRKKKESKNKNRKEGWADDSFSKGTCCLMTWVLSWGPTWGKDRTDSWKSSFDLNMYAMACISYATHKSMNWLMNK